MRFCWSMLAIGIAISLFSCKNDRGQGDTSQDIQAGQLVLQGRFENGAGLDLVLEKMDARELIPVDTVTCGENGEFRMSLLPDSPGFYILQTGQSTYLTLYLEPGENVRFSGTYGNSEDINIEGSSGSEQLLSLGKEHRNALEKLAGISRKNRELQHEEDYAHIKGSLDRRFDSITSAFRDYSIDFIGKNQESPVILVALYNLYGQGLPVFDPEKDLSVYLEVDSLLWPEFEWMESVDLLHAQLEGLKAAGAEQRKGPTVGEIAPDFVSSAPEGTKINLSAYRGSYVLLGFWASWSHPSRIQNQYVARAWERFRESALVILQVSLDENREAWITAIKEDDLLWHHVSDLERWESPVAEIYGLEKVPFLILIDPAGKILAVDIEGEELEEKLEILIKK